jgi:hypothetical protein
LRHRNKKNLLNGIKEMKRNWNLKDNSKYIALYAELTWEEAMDLSQDRLRNE